MRQKLQPSWISRTILGIVRATLLSDFSHEMCTAVLPLYLMTLGLGPGALGLIEGLADFLFSLSKLGGGIFGHHVDQKRPWASLGYLVTALATGAIGMAHTLSALLTLRGLAWIGRGFRGPLRDFLLAEAVPPTHFGRAYGLERAGDMIGAVLGPLAGVALLWFGVTFQSVILWTLLPGLLAAGSLFFVVQEKPISRPLSDDETPRAVRRVVFPRSFWVFLIGVFLFGLGDFSRTFLIWLALPHLETSFGSPSESIALGALLYGLHNLVSGAVAYPIGRFGDRRAPFIILLGGYGLGVGANLLLALGSGSLN